MSARLGDRLVLVLLALSLGLVTGGCSASDGRPANRMIMTVAPHPVLLSALPTAVPLEPNDHDGKAVKEARSSSSEMPGSRELPPGQPVAARPDVPVPTPESSAVNPGVSGPEPAAGAATFDGLSSVLPFTGTLLIADAGNDRLLEVTPDKRIVWQFPGAGSLAPGQAFHYPDDAFFSSDGRYITTNEELSHTVAVVSYDTGKIVWQYGTPGVPGSDLRHFHNPDDAHLLPDGEIVVADIRNCRIMLIPWDQSRPRALGTTGDCSGKRGSFAKPNGVTPLSNGRLLITEIGSHRVSEIDLQGRLIRATTVPLNYLSDAYLTPRDTLIVSDYHNPGHVVEADWSGHILWSFPPAGSKERLDRPSIAFELPNGNIVISDDHRDRVLVVNRRGQVLWQYGVTDVPGTAPGYLNTPDGLDQHANAAPVSQ